MIGSHLGIRSVSQSRNKRYGNALEQNDIHDLSEQEPGVVLERQILVFLRCCSSYWGRPDNLTSKE